MGVVVLIRLADIFFHGHGIKPHQSAFGIGTLPYVPFAWSSENAIPQVVVEHLAD